MTVAPELPPRQRLVQILRSLARHLPTQLAPLIEHARFADGMAALARFGDDAQLATAAAALGDAEAAWLADRLLARWRALAEPVLEPTAAIVAPAEVWVGREPLRLALSVAVVGVDPDWEVMWDGATATAGSGAVVTVDATTTVVAVRAHVRARTATGRVALTAAARIGVRTPVVTVRDDRRRIVVTDQHGAPAVGIELAIGEALHRTSPGGLVELGTPAAPGALLRVHGIPAGRIPDKT